MPIEGILVGQISQNRHKMYQICQISIQIQVPQNELQSAIFENLDVDNQMLGTCGQYEPFYSPLNAFFRSVIAQYFWSFFFEHPVYNTK